MYVNLVTFLLFFTVCCKADSNNFLPQNYYINSTTGKDDNSGISPTAAWKSLKHLQVINFKPGDSILFAKNSVFTGGFIIKNSGSENQPIVLTSYEEGSMPLFSNTDYNNLHGNAIQIKGAHINIDGLSFKNCANSPSKADKEILLVGAVYAITGADYLTVKNCEFTDCPIGIYINSQHCLITKNYLHDCNRFLSEPDWGPIGIVVGNAYNDISYNICNNYVKVGGNYGADGGFIEFEDRYFGNKVHHVDVHHNKSVANQGFLEIESKVTGDSLNVYYNFSDDFQQFIFYWGGNHSKVENNTVIRTRPSNHGSVNTVFTMTNPDFSLKNNIFLVANKIQVLVTAPYEVGNYGKLVHENNLYYCTDSSVADPCGKLLGKGEKIGDPKFKNLIGGDYHLNANSPAIKGGQKLGYHGDIENKMLPVNSMPDIGAFQYQ